MNWIEKLSQINYTGTTYIPVPKKHLGVDDSENYCEKLLHRVNQIGGKFINDPKTMDRIPLCNATIKINDQLSKLDSSRVHENQIITYISGFVTVTHLQSRKIHNNQPRKRRGSTTVVSHDHINTDGPKIQNNQPRKRRRSTTVVVHDHINTDGPSVIMTPVISSEQTVVSKTLQTRSTKQVHNNQPRKRHINTDGPSVIMTPVISSEQTVVSKALQTRSKRSPRCVCGDPMCRQISRELGSLFAECGMYYKKRILPQTGCDLNEMILHKRSEFIHKQLQTWRSKFRPDKPSIPVKGRFSEIHFGLEFLNFSKKCGSGKRVQTTLTVKQAKKFGMYRDELLVPGLYHGHPMRVLSVPTLTAEESKEERTSSWVTPSLSSNGENTKTVTTKIKIKTCCHCYHCRNPELSLQCLQPFYQQEPDVFVSKSSLHGFGLFAETNIREGTTICLYSGSRTTKDPNTMIDNETSFWATIVEDDGINWSIDSTKPNNHSGRWCNHSHKPNAELQHNGLVQLRDKRIILHVVATKDIKQYEEITINYGKDYFTDHDERLNEDVFYSEPKNKHSPIFHK